MLYNRACYDKILVSMANKSKVLVKGTPGIGKTTFLFRLLVKIVETAHESSKNAPIPSIVIHFWDASPYWLCGDGTVEAYDNTSHAAPDYYLSDAVDSACVRGSILHIVVASSKKSNYNGFKKIADCDTNMAIWTLEELLVIRGTMSREEAEFRFAVIGGSARNFLRSFPDDVYVLPLVQEIMDWITESSTWKADFKDTFEGYCRAISQELSSCTTADSSYAVFNSLMRHSVMGESRWASATMQYIAAEIHHRRDDDLWANLHSLLTPSGIGCLFESLVHRKLTSREFVCTLRPLYKKHAKRTKNNLIQLRTGYPVVLFRRPEDIANLTRNQYGLPCISNFSLIDSVVQPNNLFQVTVSAKKHDGNVAALAGIRNQLLEQDASQHSMIFVVPRDHLKSFQYQDSLGDIPQFVTTVDLVASEGVLHPAKRAKHV